jgi:hypothetical protein
VINKLDFSFVRKCISERLVVKVCWICSILVAVLHKYHWLCVHHLIAKLRIVWILWLSGGILSTVVRNVRRSELGILIVDLDVDLVIADDLFDSEIVIVAAMIDMMFVHFNDFDVVHYSISDLEVIQVTLAATSDHANHHDNEDDANYWGNY